MTVEVASFQLPTEIVEAVNHFARERRETPDQIVAEALRIALHPLRQEALKRLNAEVVRQRKRAPSSINRSRNARLDSAAEARLADLLDINRERDLSESERIELEGLFDEIEKIATERAAAIHLRGNQGEIPRQSK